MEIKLYEEKYRDKLISVWEKSVRATHDFVKPDDIEYFKQIVSGIDFNSFLVYCLVSKTRVAGFIGVSDNSVEMLFLDPDFMGRGLGRMLMKFAIEELNANKVEVNEQNVNALRFYTKLGFVPYERSEKDTQGKDYPILKLKLKNNDSGIAY